jgi:small GTP-binding protein
MKPVIALVGRPNVGKSTLFNRFTKSRDAIVADFAGLTRDRHYGDGRLGRREYIVIDTGGFEPTAETGIIKEMAKQTRQAVAEADVVIFVVDARAGLSAQDHDIARFLRTAGKKVLLAVNKAEGMVDAPQWPNSMNWASASRTRCRRRTGRACAACWRRRSRISRTTRTWTKAGRTPTGRSAWPWPAAPTSARAP